MTDAPMMFPEMTEGERHEVNRRTDRALAIVPLAAGVFVTRNQISEELTGITKGRVGLWLAGVFVAGLALNGILATPNDEFTWAAFVSLIAAAYWVSNEMRRRALKGKLDYCNERLSALAADWAAVAPGNEFWLIEKFHGMPTIDWEDSEFRRWWTAPRSNIICRVCGHSKGEAINEHLNRQEVTRTEFLHSLASREAP